MPDEIVHLPAIENVPAEGEGIGVGVIDSKHMRGGFVITAFGYADNFDSTYDFVLPFYIDDNATSIVNVTLNMLFQKYRAFAKASANESAHTHGLAIGAGGSHSHGITGQATADEGTGYTSHQHGSTIKGKAAFEAEDKDVKVRSLGVDNNDGVAKYQLVVDIGATDLSLSVGYTDTGHSHNITGQTTDAATHTHPGLTTDAGSTHTHALTFGIYEAAAYPTAVTLGVDGVDRTAALGGSWGPTAGSPTVAGLNLSEYITTTGYHYLSIGTADAGRVIPSLLVKIETKR